MERFLLLFLHSFAKIPFGHQDHLSDPLFDIRRKKEKEKKAERRESVTSLKLAQSLMVIAVMEMKTH
jgi:hypothetical protein